MTVRMVKHGLISRETSLALARELFPTLDPGAARTCSRRRSSDTSGVVISTLAKCDSDALVAPFGATALACASYCCSIENGLNDSH